MIPNIIETIKSNKEKSLVLVNLIVILFIAFSFLFSSLNVTKDSRTGELYSFFSNSKQIWVFIISLILIFAILIAMFVVISRINKGSTTDAKEVIKKKNEDKN